MPWLARLNTISSLTLPGAPALGIAFAGVQSSDACRSVFLSDATSLHRGRAARAIEKKDGN